LYDLKFHKSLTIEKWFSYSRGQQVLMIANELNRAGNLIQNNMISEMKNCYERAFELTDLTCSDQKWKGRIKELRRFREMLAALYNQTNVQHNENKKLNEALIKMNVEAHLMIG